MMLEDVYLEIKTEMMLQEMMIVIILFIRICNLQFVRDVILIDFKIKLQII